MLDLLQQFADWIWAGIEWLTGWAPGEQLKTVLEWIGTVLGAAGGVWWFVSLFRGGGAATKQDIREIKTDSATKADIDRLRQEMLDAIRSQTGPQPQLPGATGGDSLAKDLEAGIETLLKAGREEALRDKTGAAAQAALDELISRRAAARERIAKDEAALHRQKGAFAFLHDTQAAMRAYARAAELDPDDPEGWNRLGALQLRVGDLAAAEASFNKVLSLGNSLKDKSWEAIANGNLGVIYAQRGDMARACQHGRRARDLFRAIGSPTAAKVEGWMKENGCPDA